MSAATRQVVPATVLQAKRLERLLDRRREVGTAWAERASHGLPGLGELTMELTVLEETLSRQWPEKVIAWLPAWIEADARKIHDPDTTTGDGCSICAAFKQATA